MASSTLVTGLINLYHFHFIEFWKTKAHSLHFSPAYALQQQLVKRVINELKHKVEKTKSIKSGSQEEALCFMFEHFKKFVVVLS